MLPNTYKFFSFSRFCNTSNYPCLCEVLSPLLLITRLMGILPVNGVEKKGHASFCTFTNKKFWLFYSLFIQILFVIYVCFIYGNRFFTGPINQKRTEWYVMTLGYIISDFETLITVFIGCVSSKRICNNLRILAKMQGPINELRIFKKKLQLTLIICFGSYCLLFMSYTYVAILRSPKLNMSFLDTPFVVMLRGCFILYTAIEVIIVFVFCYLMGMKYKYLADLTARTLDHLFIQAGGKIIRCTATISISKRETVPKLHQLEKYYQKLSQIVDEVNKSVGLAILASITSSLYSTMYYSYRFVTATGDGITSNKNERLHYIAGLLYRSGKMFSYMLMGSHLLRASQQPLEILRNSKIVYLPPRIQQQVQTLMLQWLESKGYLSAGGIVRVGPWLLAPILGNVITYLLVAIQFNQSNSEVVQH